MHNWCKWWLNPAYVKKFVLITQYFARLTRQFHWKYTNNSDDGAINRYKNIETKSIDELAVLTKIKKISPQMVVMVICYSQYLEFRFLLEEKGILSELRMNRDLCLTSKGKILTMNETQKEFLQNLAKPENITKRQV